MPTCVASVVSTQYVLHTTSRAIQKCIVYMGKRQFGQFFGHICPALTSWPLNSCRDLRKDEPLLPSQHLVGA